MEEELIIGARRTKTVQKQNINIERHYDIQHFHDHILNYDQKNIETLAKNVQISNLKQRFNLWRIFLGVIPQEQNLMLKSIQENRNAYRKDEEKFIPVKKENAIVNPLMKNQQNNPWNNFFEDNELKNSIKIDIERTYQDKEFFQKQQIKNILQNVLFIWCKQNPSISYKQGMNEVIAILCYVYFTETPQQKLTSSQNEIVYSQFMSEDEVEPDIYAIFNKIMLNGHAEMFTNSKNITEIFEKYRSKNIEDVKINKNREIKVQYYQDAKRYKQLGVLFSVHKVETQIFLLRWIRCLCVREFHIEDAVLIWDALFYDFNQEQTNNPFLLLDSICVSMILYLKQSLQQLNDQTRILQRLLKYPPIESLYPIINQAFQFRKQIVKIDQDLKEAEDQKQLQKQNAPQKNIILFQNTLEKEAPIFQKDRQEYSITSDQKEKIQEDQKESQEDLTQKEQPQQSQPQLQQSQEVRVKIDLNENNNNSSRKGLSEFQIKNLKQKLSDILQKVDPQLQIILRLNEIHDEIQECLEILNNK